MMPKSLSILLILSILLGGCAAPVSVTPTNTATALPISIEEDLPATPSPTVPVSTGTPTPPTAPSVTSTPIPESTQTPAPTGLAIASGPDEYPPGINPLTGQMVADPETLKLPPAMISVSNSPVGARPQMGLSDAAMVFELWIGEGITRFYSVFYGDLPTQGVKGEEPAVGPIRSGRLAYEPLRRLYHGFMLFAFASKVVIDTLDYFTPVINEDLNKDINGAHVHVSEIRKMSEEYQKELGEPHLSGMRFDPVAPKGGLKADKLYMRWSWLSQVWWKYDPTSQAYNRWQDQEDGKTFVQYIDKQTGKPLAFENVVVLFANHVAFRPELIKVNFQYIKKLPALVLRDGKLYQVWWTTSSDSYERKTGRLRPIRFVDNEGKPFALKPGQTWVAVMNTGSPWYETVDSEDPTWLATKTAPNSGVWAVRYFVPEPIPTEMWMTEMPR